MFLQSFFSRGPLLELSLLFTLEACNHICNRVYPGSYLPPAVPGGVRIAFTQARYFCLSVCLFISFCSCVFVLPSSCVRGTTWLLNSFDVLCSVFFRYSIEKRGKTGGQAGEGKVLQLFIYTCNSP